MAYEEVLQSITLDADASIGVFTGVPGVLGGPANNSALQYRFVKITGEHTAGLVTVPGTDVPVGVLQNKPQRVGDAATVGIFGISKVEAAGALAAGAPVYADATGRATATAGGNILGYAIHSTASAGELATVLLRLK
jgi:predicted RecA/RadA family phage recombinase